MIPSIDILSSELVEITHPSKTYKVDVDEKRINGYTDELNAVIQSIYLILNTERYMYPIYSWNYGFESVDLIGQPKTYVLAEIPRRVKDALMQDDRIIDVKDFEFEIKKNKVHTKFTVVTDLGDVDTKLEVNI